jgi:hypothetical protein
LKAIFQIVQRGPNPMMAGRVPLSSECDR